MTWSGQKIHTMEILQQNWDMSHISPLSSQLKLNGCGNIWETPRSIKFQAHSMAGIKQQTTYMGQSHQTWIGRTRYYILCKSCPEGIAHTFISCASTVQVTHRILRAAYNRNMCIS